MPIIIDGWNLIRSGSSVVDDDGDGFTAIMALLQIIRRFQKTHRDPITLVFDSRSGHLGLPHIPDGTIRIVAAKDADEYIRRQVDETPERQRRNLRVVSSDTAVYFYAKDRYATPIKSDTFWSTLTSKGGRAKESSFDRELRQFLKNGGT